MNLLTKKPKKSTKKMILRLICRVRANGLKGIYTYVTYSDDLDGFVAKYVDIQKQTRVVQSILINLLEYGKDR